LSVELAKEERWRRRGGRMLDLGRGQEEGGQRLLVGVLAGCAHPIDPRAQTLGGALLLVGAWAVL
jgi:hypothetical protein